MSGTQFPVGSWGLGKLLGNSGYSDACGCPCNIMDASAAANTADVVINQAYLPKIKNLDDMGCANLTNEELKLISKGDLKKLWHGQCKNCSNECYPSKRSPNCCGWKWDFRGKKWKEGMGPVVRGRDDGDDDGGGDDDPKRPRKSGPADSDSSYSDAASNAPTDSYHNAYWAGYAPAHHQRKEGVTDNSNAEVICPEVPAVSSKSPAKCAEPSKPEADYVESSEEPRKSTPSASSSDNNSCSKKYYENGKGSKDFYDSNYADSCFGKSGDKRSQSGGDRELDWDRKTWGGNDPKAVWGSGIDEGYEPLRTSDREYWRFHKPVPKSNKAVLKSTNDIPKVSKDGTTIWMPTGNWTEEDMKRVSDKRDEITSSLNDGNRRSRSHEDVVQLWTKWDKWKKDGVVIQTKSVETSKVEEKVVEVGESDAVADESKKSEKEISDEIQRTYPRIDQDFEHSRESHTPLSLSPSPEKSAASNTEIGEDESKSKSHAELESTPDTRAASPALSEVSSQKSVSPAKSGDSDDIPSIGSDEDFHEIFESTSSVELSAKEGGINAYLKLKKGKLGFLQDEIDIVQQKICLAEIQKLRIRQESRRRDISRSKSTFSKGEQRHLLEPENQLVEGDEEFPYVREAILERRRDQGRQKSSAEDDIVKMTLAEATCDLGKLVASRIGGADPDRDDDKKSVSFGDEKEDVGRKSRSASRSRPLRTSRSSDCCIQNLQKWKPNLKRSLSRRSLSVGSKSSNGKRQSILKPSINTVIPYSETSSEDSDGADLSGNESDNKSKLGDELLSLINQVVGNTVAEEGNVARSAEPPEVTGESNSNLLDRRLSMDSIASIDLYGSVMSSEGEN